MAQAIAWRRIGTFRLIIGALALAVLAGCATLPFEEPRPRESSPPDSGAGPALPPEGSTTPLPESERSARPMPLPTPAPVPEAVPPSYHPAGEALVEQARREVLLGDDALAGATLERALRVDGNNPWIWIELGHLRLAAGQRAAAESMARKALSLTSRDPAARTEATRLLQRAGGG